MASPARVLYNPGMLGDVELVESFSVRNEFLRWLLDLLAESAALPSSRHVLIVGPRGIGKTTLVRRVAVELRSSPRMAEHWYPVVFGEESYEVTTAGEFWLAALSRLASQTGSDSLLAAHTDLRLTERDDTRLGERALGQLVDFAHERQRRLLLVVENLHMLMDEQVSTDDGWTLRKTLQHEPAITILGTATTRFEAIDRSDQPWWELFSVHELKPLSLDECQDFWSARTKTKLGRGQSREIQIVTGGNPRLLGILCDFAAGRQFGEFMSQLVDLVDRHTEYFKHHLDNLGTKERKVFATILEAWKPVGSGEIAKLARLPVGEVSVMVKRLMDRGAVRPVSDGRRKTYEAAERLFNIYYLMRHRGQPDDRVRAAVTMMMVLYEGDDLADRIIGIAADAMTLSAEARRDHYAAYSHLLIGHPELLPTIVPRTPGEFLRTDSLPEFLRLAGDLMSEVEIGERVFRAGDYQGAAARFRKALEIEPRSGILWGALGAALWLGGKQRDAKEAMEKARELPLPRAFESALDELRRSGAVDLDLGALALAPLLGSIAGLTGAGLAAVPSGETKFKAAVLETLRQSKGDLLRPLLSGVQLDAGEEPDAPQEQKAMGGDIAGAIARERSPLPITPGLAAAAKSLLLDIARGTWSPSDPDADDPAFDVLCDEWWADDGMEVVIREFLLEPGLRTELQRLVETGAVCLDFTKLELLFRTACRRSSVDAPAELSTRLGRWFWRMEDILFPERLAEHQQARMRYLEALTGKKLPEGLKVLSAFADCHQLEPTFELPRVQFDDEEPVAASALFRARGLRAVLLGQPGAGKTTLLRCFALAAAGHSEFGWAAGNQRLPVFCRLREWRDDELMWSFLRRCTESALGVELPANFFEREAQTNGLMVLFDSLDEAKWNKLPVRLAAFEAQLPADCTVIVSSRPGEWVRAVEGFQFVWMCELDDEEIRGVIRRYCARFDKAGAPDLWAAVKSREDLWSLARNPLLLAKMILLHYRIAELPDSRVDLYEKFTETLLQNEWGRALYDLLPTDPARGEFLAFLAFEMERVQAVSTSVADLASYLRSYLKPYGVSQDRMAEIIAQLQKCDTILFESGAGEFRFKHRSFQRYFAASHIANELPQQEFDRLIDKPPEGWEDTLSMAIGLQGTSEKASTLLRLIASSRIELARNAATMSVELDPWLATLTGFIARYYGDCTGPTAAECAEAILDEPEAGAVLQRLFDRDTRDARALASAVELAEELSSRGDQDAAALLDNFFAEAQAFHLDQNMADCEGFRIDRHLVTSRDFECMIPAHRKLRDATSNHDDQPVVHVSAIEAELFCRWRGGSLPTEEQWYKAASWDPVAKRNRKYPWGDEWDAAKANTREAGPGRTTPIGAYPPGASAYGCHDMAGNVWEWTQDRDTDGTVWVRGGSWKDGHPSVAAAYRFDLSPSYRGNDTGFRCVKE